MALALIALTVTAFNGVVGIGTEPTRYRVRVLYGSAVVLILLTLAYLVVVPELALGDLVTLCALAWVAVVLLMAGRFVARAVESAEWLEGVRFLRWPDEDDERP